ncbi:MAG TPA: hypothetical protein V6C89_11130 [Drouetiella sp.]
MESKSDCDQSSWYARFKLLCKTTLGSHQNKAGEDATRDAIDGQADVVAEELVGFEQKQEQTTREANHVLEEYWLASYQKSTGEKHAHVPAADADQPPAKSPSRTSWHGFDTSTGNYRAVKPSLIFAKKTTGVLPDHRNTLR